MTTDFTPIPSSILTIRFQDCDPFNHLNNGRYVDYFLNAREDQLLEHYDLDIYKIARETGLCWVVSTSQIGSGWPAARPASARRPSSRLNRYVWPSHMIPAITWNQRTSTFSHSLTVASMTV